MAIQRINYNAAVRQSTEIRELSTDLGYEIQKLEDLQSRIKQSWKGPACNEFLNQLTVLIADMKTTKKNMSSVASTIANTAKRIKDEDDRKAAEELRLLNANTIL